jgi:dihydroxyacetone kinase-like protein
MPKVMNSAADFVDEMLDGFVAANPSLARGTESPNVIVRSAPPSRPRVGVVSGGGSGHLPLFTGYVGPGLLDACSIGNVFEGPSVDSCLAAIRAVQYGEGVLCLYGNYGGDRMNFDLACEMLYGEIETTTVLGNDDIASGSADAPETRRGVAGIVYAYKAAGAAAARGDSLAEVTSIAQKAVARTRTIGFALSSCELPGAGKPSFEIHPGEVEMGMGIHGEPGIWRGKLGGADELADEMLKRLLDDAPADAGARVSLLVNSLGATSHEELFILYRRLDAALRHAGYTIGLPLVGRYVTSLEMAGASVSLCFLDEELEAVMGMPASCPFWTVA